MENAMHSLLLSRCPVWRCEGVSVLNLECTGADAYLLVSTYLRVEAFLGFRSSEIPYLGA